ncbi:MAG: hypothetical protein GEV11_01740 [Streptosporangiales bacterium]|nr:hypothetical protein [Streptosporangiales bacterium]
MVLYAEEDRESTNLTETPEGGYSVTTSQGNSQGLDLRGGFGAQVGGIGLNATVGGDYMWTGEDQQRGDFESEEQYEEWRDRVESAQEEIRDEYGDAFFLDEDVLEEFRDIPLRKVTRYEPGHDAASGLPRPREDQRCR